MRRGLALLFAIVLSAFVSAGCAYDSHSRACEACFANATGIQAQQECFDSMGAEIIACYSQEYPMLAVASSKDECPEMNNCLAQSSSCVVSAGAVSAGDICGSEGIASCMRELDSCMESANGACKPRGEAVIAGEVEKGVRGICPCIGGLALAAGFLVACRR